MINSIGLEKAPAACRVVVAMSGGVDSSVVAALLAREGYDVVGITLQLYDHGAPTNSTRTCCAGRDIHDARNVADRLGIPHFVLDFESRFREAVIDDFTATYAAGRTPIPCVRCNERIKFRDLLEVARDLGADALATGHYVRRTTGKDGPELHRAADLSKDQSYFLFATTRDQLDLLRFPLGDHTKERTRELASELNLPVAAKPDSQDICFIPNGHYSDLVTKLHPTAADPGDIVDTAGNVLGRHNGIAHYTVGQRRGLGIPAADRLYVIRLDPENRHVVVGPRSETLCPEAHLTDVSWLSSTPIPAEGIAVDVKHRANEPDAPATLYRTNTGARVTFAAPQSGVAPGQACVFYKRTRVLGGGWIKGAPVGVASDLLAKADQPIWQAST